VEAVYGVCINGFKPAREIFFSHYSIAPGQTGRGLQTTVQASMKVAAGHGNCQLEGIRLYIATTV
ncbi:MAG: hypothetical protein OIF34_02185, partial [Porticoccaceae bacterium]|nr:hypothetical protein [Porticoccaceae bacterium]